MGRAKRQVREEGKHRGKARVVAPSPYRAMWLLAMFDLPVKSKAARKAYGRFRKSLLSDGFVMLQLSVCGRYCASEDAAQVHMRRVEAAIPSRGQVRVISVTDMQFGRMRVFEGRKELEPEGSPRQLELF